MVNSSINWPHLLFLTYGSPWFNPSTAIAVALPRHNAVRFSGGMDEISPASPIERLFAVAVGGAIFVIALVPAGPRNFGAGPRFWGPKKRGSKHQTSGFLLIHELIHEFPSNMFRHWVLMSETHSEYGLIIREE